MAKTMSRTKHSRAPWSADPEGEHAKVIEDANGYPIAEVYELTRRAEGEANQRLMVAAPDMLRALKVIALDPRIFEWLKDNDPKALHQVQRAIAAAELD